MGVIFLKANLIGRNISHCFKDPFIVYLHVFFNIYLKTLLYNSEQLIRNAQEKMGKGGIIRVKKLGF